MAFIWDTKNNFILSHFVHIYQQRQKTSISDIDWLTIVKNISLEISATPIVKYEFLKCNYLYIVLFFFASY